MDTVLLRFRDLTQGVDTIKAHNSIGRNTYNIISIDSDNRLHIIERVRGENGVGFFSYNEKEIIL